jgi:hypothetical protein
MLKVFVYWNLPKECWSVKALNGTRKGKVIYHAEQVRVANPVGKVSEAGRQRVLREKCKNVHAGIVGELTDVLGQQTEAGHDVHISDLGWDHSEHWINPEGMTWADPAVVVYDPYKHATFVCKNAPLEGEPAPQRAWGRMDIAVDGRPVVLFHN